MSFQDDLPDGSAKADNTARAFEQAGERIANALERAARSGEFSFNNMVESITQDLVRLAINEVFSALFSGSDAAPSRTTNVNMTVNGVTDPSSFQRSSGQISAMLARAVSDGQRYL